MNWMLEFKPEFLFLEKKHLESESASHFDFDCVKPKLEPRYIWKSMKAIGTSVNWQVTASASSTSS